MEEGGVSQLGRGEWIDIGQNLWGKVNGGPVDLIVLVPFNLFFYETYASLTIHHHMGRASSSSHSLFLDAFLCLTRPSTECLGRG